MRIALRSSLLVAAIVLAPRAAIASPWSVGAGVGIVSVRGEDLGAGSFAAPLALVHVGYRFSDGLGPELRVGYASFAADAPISNLVFVAPGLRWSPSTGALRPWLGAHVDASWFSFGLACSVEDTAMGYSVHVRPCDSTGFRLGFDVAGGIDWKLSRAFALGTELSWASSSPVDSPRSEPAPPGATSPPLEPSHVRAAWTMLAGFTFFFE